MTTNSINYAKLQEEKRANAEKERLSAESNRIESAKVAESSRSNRANEVLKYQAQLETERHNKIEEEIGYAGTAAKIADTVFGAVSKVVGWI